MNKADKQNKLLIKEVARLLQRPVRNGDEIVLSETDEVRSLLSTRCIQSSDDAQEFSIEASFAVQVFALPVAWSRYSGRKGDPDTYSAVLSLRNAVFPGNDLPDWGFSFSLRDISPMDAVVGRIAAVAATCLVRLAQRCGSAADLLALAEEGVLAFHRFDTVLLLKLAGRDAECELALVNARAFFADPDLGPTNPAILVSMCDRLADDLASQPR